VQGAEPDFQLLGHDVNLGCGGLRSNNDLRKKMMGIDRLQITGHYGNEAGRAEGVEAVVEKELRGC
jgi:hypothetical protein